jgi:hypothetical protein
MHVRRKAEDERRECKKASNKRVWVRPWIQRQKTFGGEHLLRELCEEDPSSYTNALRMNAALFHELLSLVEGTIQRQNTSMRNALSAVVKLQVTLRYLATGDSFKSLSLLFRVPPLTISTFLPEVLDILHTLLALYLKVSVYVFLLRKSLCMLDNNIDAMICFVQVPETTDEWRRLSSGGPQLVSEFGGNPAQGRG